MHLRQVLAFLWITALAGCESPTRPLYNATLVGKVLNSTNNSAVAGAIVSVTTFGHSSNHTETRIVTSDSNGLYIAHFLLTPWAAIKVNDDRYFPFREEINISEGVNRFDVRLRPR